MNPEAAATVFLRYPRLTILLTGLITVAGLSAFAVLPRMEDPILTSRAGLILTPVPGVDAEQVEALVTDPIEEELREIEEIKELRSDSRSSLSVITIELHAHVYQNDAPAVWSRIRDRLGDAESQLPPQSGRPLFEELEVTAYTRMVALVWDPPAESSLLPDQSAAAITRRLAESLRDELLAVPGTKEAELFGVRPEEILVEIDEDRLAAAGLTPSAVSQQLVAADSRVSSGTVYADKHSLSLEVSGELDSLDRIRRIPLLTNSSAATIYLGDVAGITRSTQTPTRELSLVDGKPAVLISCLIRPDQRIDLWTERTEAVTKAFSSTLPKGLRLTDVFSQNEYVSTRLSDLLGNLMLGAASVMGVILVMMGWRNAVIVGCSLPLTSFMVLASMRWMEIPIHQMSVTGLIIALGLLIDNAIVVVDDVTQKRRKGLSPAGALAETLRHLAIPLFGSTFTTALAFAPIALMPGPAGEFVGAIAVNVIVAVFSSLFVALTVVSTLAAVSFRPTPPQDSSRSLMSPVVGTLRQGIHIPFLADVYQRFLRLILHRPLIGITLGLTLPVLGFSRFSELPEQFFPPADRDQVSLEIELPAGTPITETSQGVLALRQRLLEENGVKSVTWFVGRSAPPFYYNQIPSRRGTPHFAQALVRLDSIENLETRIRSIQRISAEALPEARVLARQLEQGPPFSAPIEIRIFGPDAEIRADIGNRFRALLSAYPEVTQIRSEATESSGRLLLAADEEAIRTLGLNEADIAAQLAGGLEGIRGGLILEDSEDLPVRVRLGRERRDEVSRLHSVTLLSSSGTGDGYAGIPLEAVTNASLIPDSPVIPRINSRRMNEVQVYLQAGVLPAGVLERFQQQLSRLTAENELSLPPGYEVEFGGESAKRDDAIGNLMASVGVLLVLMVAALVLSFRSFRMAALIGCVGAMSIGLGLGALWLFGWPFGFVAIIGTMGLVGVAINDSIVVLAGIRENPDARAGDPDAVRAVVTSATRHVTSTSLTTIAGFLPLWLGGGGFWPPLAVAIAGGVGGATLLALIFIPSAYQLIVRVRLPLWIAGNTVPPAAEFPA